MRGKCTSGICLQNAVTQEWTLILPVIQLITALCYGYGSTTATFSLHLFSHTKTALATAFFLEQ